MRCTALALAVVVGCSGAPEPAAVPVSEPATPRANPGDPTSLTVAFQANVHGDIEPCG